MSTWCSTCHRYFGDHNELLQHKQVHLPYSYECYGCTNTFRRYPDMISHLELGGCPCGIDAEDLNQSAAMCYQWKHFLDPDFRVDMLRQCADYSRNYTHDGMPWKCPGCGKWFKKLSSLFQHVWSPSCGQEENEWPMSNLKRWLWNRHG